MTQLSPSEQQELLGEITTALVTDLPDTWVRLIMDYANIGRRVSVAAAVRLADGETVQISPPKELARAFMMLRRGMHTPEHGAWYSLELIIDPPDMFKVHYNWDDEPRFPSPTPAEQFAVDLERFPRAEVPDWFARQLPG